MLKASLANAVLNGNDYLSPLDITSVIKPVLRHRILLNYKAMAKNLTPDLIIGKITQSVRIS